MDFDSFKKLSNPTYVAFEVNMALLMFHTFGFFSGFFLEDFPIFASNMPGENPSANSNPSSFVELQAIFSGVHVACAILIEACGH